MYFMDNITVQNVNSFNHYLQYLMLPYNEAKQNLQNLVHENPSFLLARNKNGNTPLHIAMHNDLKKAAVVLELYIHNTHDFNYSSFNNDNSTVFEYFATTHLQFSKYTHKISIEEKKLISKMTAFFLPAQENNDRIFSLVLREFKQFLTEGSLSCTENAPLLQLIFCKMYQNSTNTTLKNKALEVVFTSKYFAQSTVDALLCIDQDILHKTIGESSIIHIAIERCLNELLTQNMSKMDFISDIKSSGDNVLHTAINAKIPSYEVIELILNKGIIPDYPNNAGQTPIDLILNRIDKFSDNSDYLHKIFLQLYKHSQNQEIKLKAALIYFTKADVTNIDDITNLLDEFTADDFNQLYNGTTFMHVAAQQQNLALIEYLMNKNVNFGIKDSNNHTPIQEIISKGYEFIDDYCVVNAEYLNTITSLERFLDRKKHINQYELAKLIQNSIFNDIDNSIYSLDDKITFANNILSESTIDFNNENYNILINSVAQINHTIKNFDSDNIFTASWLEYIKSWLFYSNTKTYATQDFIEVLNKCMTVIIEQHELNDQIQRELNSITEYNDQLMNLMLNQSLEIESDPELDMLEVLGSGSVDLSI